MIFVDDSLIKISGTLLPGIVKSIEITDAARIEEQEVEGSSVKPKQVAGYEDAKVTIEILLLDSENQTMTQKLEVIQNVFRKAGQAKPSVHSIVNEHTSARRVSQVVFKSLATKIESKREQITATLEFWAYIPMKITAKKAADGAATYASSLIPGYQAYLSSGKRGTAPTRTIGTPAVDDASPTSIRVSQNMSF